MSDLIKKATRGPVGLFPQAHDLHHREGRTYRTRTEVDHDAPPPWEVRGDIGLVSDWMRDNRSSADRIAKGDRVLTERDRWVRLFYRNDAIAAFLPGGIWTNATPSNAPANARERAENRAQSLFRAWQRWCDNKWTYMTITVETPHDYDLEQYATAQMRYVPSNMSVAKYQRIRETLIELAGYRATLSSTYLETEDGRAKARRIQAAIITDTAGLAGEDEGAWIC